jgi:glycosyltransferase involved in cell wall biosynthesis
LFLSRIAPVVIRLHGSELIFRKHSGVPTNQSVRWNDSLEAVSCRRAAAITTPSQFQANEIINHRGWPAERVRVIPNAVSENMLRAALEFSRNGHSERVVLYTGRLAPVKGIETLLEAAKLVHQSDPSITFVLAGPWQMPQAPEAYGLTMNKTSPAGVKWIGPQKEDALIDWYKRASLFVMPSFYESFGISVVEAMAFGLPIVATATGALPEVLGTPGPALFVPKGDAKKLAEGITRLVSSPQKDFAKCNGTLRQRACDLYSPSRVAAETINLYQDLTTLNRK